MNSNHSTHSKFGRVARIGLSVSALISVVFTGFAQIADPIPENVELSDIVMTIERYAQIPSSSGSAPRARINHLKPMHDSQGRVAVNDLNGLLYTVANSQVVLYLNLDDEFGDFVDSPNLGTGFSSFAFHPDFEDNGRFYTAHTERSGSGAADFTGPVTNAPVRLQGVVVEWVAESSSSATFSGTKRELMRVDLTHTIHGMQEISFNPNASVEHPDYGNLYICIGDGGATIRGLPENTHRLDSVLGTILRIDPAGNNSANGSYGIPVDNPWANDAEPNTFGEIWAYGFRNPHRISWDTAGDGKMLVGDIGEKQIEEINLVLPGRDYGWNEREGTFVINPDFANNPGAGDRDELFELPVGDFGYTYPVAQYDRSTGRAIVGGYVYRGSSIPSLSGKYIFGDIVDGKVYFVEADSLELGKRSEIKELELEFEGQKRSMLDLVSDSRVDLRFGYDARNELYLLEKRNGMVYKITGTNAEEEPAPSAGTLANISTRGIAGSGAASLIGGFVTANGSQQLLIQAVGPELSNLGVEGALADPTITLVDSNQNVVLTIDDWEERDPNLVNAIRAEVGAIPLEPGSASAAVVVVLEAGLYSVIVSSGDGSQGLALLEIYESD